MLCGAVRSQASSEGRRTLTLLGCRARRRLRHDGRVATAVLGRADAHVQPALGLVVTADAGCLSNRFCSVLLCPVHGLDPIPQRVVPSGGAAREAAAGTLGSISGFPSVAPKARIWRTFLASILRMSWHQLKACPRPRLTSSDLRTVFGFCYLFVWGYIADLSMVPRLRRGRLASRALRTPFISCAVKRLSRSQKKEKTENATMDGTTRDFFASSYQSISRHPKKNFF